MKQVFQHARTGEISVVEVPAPKLLPGCVLVRHCGVAGFGGDGKGILGVCQQESSTEGESTAGPGP